MKQQRFWNVDLIELVKVWFADMGVFLLTALTFVGMAIPVLIPMQMGQTTPEVLVFEAAEDGDCKETTTDLEYKL